jgi:hypothetical protein
LVFGHFSLTGLHPVLLLAPLWGLFTLSTFNFQLSTFNFQLSTFNFQLSTFLRLLGTVLRTLSTQTQTLLQNNPLAADLLHPAAFIRVSFVSGSLV